MLIFFYNLTLCLFLLLYCPIHIIRLILGSKYRSSTLPRLGFQAYPKANKSTKTYLIHSVSVGETQVAGTLCTALKKAQPDCRIFVSTCTETGQAVASKLQDADGHFYLPYDLHWQMNRMLKSIQPDAQIIIENDIWLNHLACAERQGIPCFLINGKLSENSLKSYKKHKTFGTRLFRPFKHLFVQSETYRDRFLDLGIESKDLTISGNIKLDTQVPHMNEAERQAFLQSLGLQNTNLEMSLIYGSTHAGEEELALATHLALSKEFPHLQTIIVPRHPERFTGVCNMLKKANASFTRASELSQDQVSESILVVDQMGALMKLYDIGAIGIVCGTFTPHVGGHNILEPAFYEKPFVYGPWIYKQPGFQQLCLQSKVGIQCPPEELVSQLKTLLASPEAQKQKGLEGAKIIESSRGATQHSVDEMLTLLKDL
jgi:3-deoxy-D-manno-octulosonic-acid transferase